MRNRIGFVPSNAPIQPSYYKRCFNAWCAVFYRPSDDEEYHLQLVLDPWEWQNGHKNAKSVAVLMQTPNHRVGVFRKDYPSICQAVNALAKVLAPENAPEEER